jgi:S-layer homology domain
MPTFSNLLTKSICVLGVFALVLSTLFSVLPTKVEAGFTSPFPDVKSDNNYYSHINNLKEYGIVSGFSDGNFGSDKTLTRGEMSKFVKNAIFDKNYTNTTCTNFPDNNLSDTFYTEILTLKCEGVVGGFGDGNFKSDKNVSRGEATKFVINALRKKYKDEGFLAVDANKNIDLATFRDIDKNNTFYEYINVVIGKKIIQLYEDGKYVGSFKPDQPILRKEMAEMVWNGMQMRNLKENVVTVKPKNATQFEKTVWDGPLCFLVCIQVGMEQYRGVLYEDQKDSYKVTHYREMLVSHKNAITPKQYDNFYDLSVNFIENKQDPKFYGIDLLRLIDILDVKYDNATRSSSGYFLSGFEGNEREVRVYIFAIKGDEIVILQQPLKNYTCSAETKTTSQCIQEFKSNPTLKIEAQKAAQELVETFAIAN